MFFKLFSPLAMAATAVSSIESLANDKENNHKAVSNKRTDLSSSYLAASQAPEDYSGPSSAPCGTPTDDSVKVTDIKSEVNDTEPNNAKCEKDCRAANNELPQSFLSKNEHLFKDDLEKEDPEEPNPGENTKNTAEDDYFEPLKRLAMCQSSLSPKLIKEKQTPPKLFEKTQIKSFSITDILRYNPSTNSNRIKLKELPVLEREPAIPECPVPLAKIVRPWDKDDDAYEQELDSDDNMSISSRSSVGSPCYESSEESRLLPVQKGDGSPLDALFQMTSKTFDGVRGNATSSGLHANSFGKHPLKKKRKTRTAFSNQQIFELEKRFLYQKYLSPADRDELAQKLGLSNAQVITWFQNRRAKLKRDMEELKKDHTSAALIGDHRIFLKTMTQMGLLKSKLCEQLDYRK